MLSHSPHRLALVLGALLPPTSWSQQEAAAVVLTGSDLPNLVGTAVGDVVAFRYEDAWIQVPVQVDEVKEANFGDVLQNPGIDFTGLFYADPDTFTGADADPLFDLDDELCFLVEDVGSRAADPDPPGVVKGTRTGLLVRSPTTGAEGYVYLFVGDGSLDPAAGADHVVYGFSLDSGSYLSTYETGQGFNPESTLVQTPSYSLQFADRWVMDGLLVETAADPSQLLDRHKFQFMPDDCSRTEETFSLGPGAFSANVDGPVRAIRAVVGANSAPITERHWIFYPHKMEVRNYVRVHQMSGVWDYYDYSPAAQGLTYFDPHNTGGLVIDGVPSPHVEGEISWQLVSGDQGSLTHVFEIETDIPDLQLSSHFYDDATPALAQCTGDGWQFGASGPQLIQIPSTDPLDGEANRLTYTRTVYFDPTGGTVADAMNREAETLQPPTAKGLLTVDVEEISISAGGQQDFALDLGSVHGGDTYWILGSLGGTSPGFDLGSVHLPLVMDVYMLMTINCPNINPPMGSTLGTLDPDGSANAFFVLPPGLTTLPSALGWHCALVFSTTTGEIRAVTQTVPLRFVP